MFTKNESPSQRGNCLEFDPIDQDLLILESSTVVLNFEPVEKEIDKILSEMKNFECILYKKDLYYLTYIFLIYWP